MKLFIWEGPRALSEEYAGIAIAIASSIEEAIQLIMEKYRATAKDIRDWEAPELLEKQLREQLPEIYESPNAVYFCY